MKISQSIINNLLVTEIACKKTPNTLMAHVLESIHPSEAEDDDESIKRFYL